jgi:BirA family biotin operon repressor/biotin-[acetyl-CoA-carboxylase] ligase
VSQLDLDRVRSLLLPGEVTWSLHFEPVCDSTQDLARAAATAGADQGWLIATDLQQAGRGRQGHAWITPPASALLLSLVLRPPIDVVNKLPLLVGLAVAGGIESTTRLSPDLKWPNDVLLDGKKLAGILIERPTGGTVVIGMGINVNQARDQLPEGAASLALALGQPVEREALLAVILNDLGNAYERADREGVQWIVPAWRSRSSMLGQRISFVRDSERVLGQALDLTDEGALVVATDDGRRLELIAGEVERIRPA